VNALPSHDISGRSLPAFALIGFGEAGSILGSGLAALGARVSMYDVKLDDAGLAAEMRSGAMRGGVHPAATLAQAITGADIIVSAVTAASAMAVGESAAALIRRGQVYVDINSISPQSKRSICECIEGSGGSFVEAAVMAPVPPNGLQVPMLLGGPCAESVANTLGSLGMNARAVATEVGVASAIKMCRSVMIKGLEALTVECMAAARRYHAEDEVLASLARTFPGMGWDDDLPNYLISRVAQHGRRRAAEMREVAATLSEAGIEPHMSAAVARVQAALPDAMRRSGIEYDSEAPFSWRLALDKVGDRYR